MATVEKIETEMNARAKCWARILNIGAAWGHQKRVKQAVTSSSGEAPVLCGLSKDHKAIGDGEEHPLRPVCGADHGPGSKISYLLANMITPCNEEFSSENQLESTEDLQAKIQQFNDLPSSDRQDIVVYSMDVKALYPSLDIRRTSEAVMTVIEKSSVVFKEIDYTELSRYLAVTVEEKVIEDLGLREVTMSRRYKKGARPSVIGEEMKKHWEEDKSSWLRPSREPTEEERRRMLALAVAKDVECVMKKHVYKFAGEVYNQNEGGSIGNELTGVVAKTRMIFLLRRRLQLIWTLIQRLLMPLWMMLCVHQKWFLLDGGMTA